MQREAMEYDVVIVGGGPSGLSAAIRLRQLAADAGRDVSVCVLEKGSEIGAHILSGAVIDPRALNELIPDWQAKGAPLNTPVTEDRFLVLSADKARRLPNWMMPPLMDNHGSYIVSLGNVCRWLAQQAESVGVEIYPGFVKMFKAPNWELDNEVYAGCRAAGFAIADHIRNIEILPETRQPHYIYNIRLRNDKYQRLHGHIQPWAGTGLTEGATNGTGINPAYLLPVGTPYAFCTEAVTENKEVPV